MSAVMELDDILDAAHAPEVEDGFTVARAAEILNRDHSISMGRDRLFAHLADIGWITRESASHRWIGRTDARQAGWVIVRDTVVRVGLGRDVVPQVFITLAGLAELHRTLRSTDPPDPAPLPPLFDD